MHCAREVIAGGGNAIGEAKNVLYPLNRGGLFMGFNRDVPRWTHITLLYALYASGLFVPVQSSFAGVEVMSLNRDGLFMGTEHW